MIQAFYLLFSYVNRLMFVHITGFLCGVVISSMDGSFIIVRWYVMQVITVALSKINQRTNSFSKVFVWRVRNMECALQAVFIYNKSRDTWGLTKDICRMDVVTDLLVMRRICRLRDHVSVKAMTLKVLRSRFMPITKIFVWTRVPDI